MKQQFLMLVLFLVCVGAWTAVERTVSIISVYDTISISSKSSENLVQQSAKQNHQISTFSNADDVDFLSYGCCNAPFQVRSIDDGKNARVGESTSKSGDRIEIYSILRIMRGCARYLCGVFISILLGFVVFLSVMLIHIQATWGSLYRTKYRYIIAPVEGILSIRLLYLLLLLLIRGCNGQAVYSTGYNAQGQLGLGDTTNRYTPTWIKAGGISSVSIKAISAGFYQSSILSNTGFVYSIGYNGNGELGLGDTTDRYTPTLITAGGLSSVSITSISAESHSLMLSKTGLVYSTGNNGWGQLGLGDTSNRWTPTLITAGGLSSVFIKVIFINYRHSLMVSSTGFVYSNGYNGYGQLGLGDTTDRLTPTMITAGGLSSVSMTAISAAYHSLLKSSTGLVYSVGNNAGGQLGLGDTTERWTPTLITAGGLSSITITSIAAGGYYDGSGFKGHSLFLSSSGKVYGCGTNAYGELALGDTTMRATPTLVGVGALSSVSITFISAGLGDIRNIYPIPYSMLVSSESNIYGTGGNNHGQLGIGDTTDRYTATLLNTLTASNLKTYGISAGYGSSLILVDTNECTSNTHNCNTNAACTNTAGSFTCSCNVGYNGNGVLCSAGADLCSSTHNCDSHATCVSMVTTYTCKCNAGYTGSGTSCADVNECATFSHNCVIGASCFNTAGSFTCACNVGYNGNGLTSCADINECTSNTHNCNTNAACTNIAGSFVCVCNLGYSGSGTICAEMDECATSKHNCHMHSVCTNTVGSFSCLCNTGYTGSGVICADVNECTSSTHNCVASSTCYNNAGSFSCSCNVGYSGSATTSCADIDECGLGLHNCNIHAICANTVGSFGCTCNGLFNGNGVTCNDINECVGRTHNCNTLATCTNTPGSFSCACNSGYTGDGISSCTDINECTSNTIHNCNTNAVCSNIAGSFTCTCNTGFTGSGVACPDLNECSLKVHNCNDNGICSNTAGSYSCSCRPGYSGDGITSCTDIDECTAGTHNCNSLSACSNTIGSFSCSCNAGYTGSGVQCVQLPSTCKQLVCNKQVVKVLSGENKIFSSTSQSAGPLKFINRSNKPLKIVGSASGQAKFETTTEASLNVEISSFADASTSVHVGKEGDYVDDCSYSANPCNSPIMDHQSFRCPSGYTIQQNICTDINECSINNGGCKAVPCKNTAGSFSCECNLGYAAVSGTCTDVNECTLNNGGCGSVRCVNTAGSFKCSL